MLKYMLDTNTCIFVIKNKPEQARVRFNEHAAHLCMSSVTLAELFYGAEKSLRSTDNLAVVEDFAARMDVLSFDDRAAAHYGNLRAELERAGKTIGPYDLMIAAHARSLGLVIVTNNQREFTRVPGLRIEDWLA